MSPLPGLVLRTKTLLKNACSAKSLILQHRSKTPSDEQYKKLRAHRGLVPLHFLRGFGCSILVYHINFVFR